MKVSAAAGSLSAVSVFRALPELTSPSLGKTPPPLASPGGRLLGLELLEELPHLGLSEARPKGLRGSEAPRLGRQVRGGRALPTRQRRLRGGDLGKRLPLLCLSANSMKNKPSKVSVKPSGRDAETPHQPELVIPRLALECKAGLGNTLHLIVFLETVVAEFLKLLGVVSSSPLPRSCLPSRFEK